MELNKFYFFNTPLIHAVLQNNIEIVKLLVSKISTNINCVNILEFFFQITFQFLYLNDILYI